MSTMNIYDMADTWNDGATTFSAIRMNVTDTASASGSLLMDLQVGGVSQFKVSKAGGSVTLAGAGAFAANEFLSHPGVKFRYTGSDRLNLINRGGTASICFKIDSNAAVISPQFGLASSITDSVSADVVLTRDAANTLAQRNGVNAQAFRVYNTFTDASNYERGVFDFTSVANQLTIGSEKAGTGATRIVRFVVGGTRVAISDGSYFQIDQDLYALGNVIMAAKYTQMSEMTAPAAPAANGVRIYAEDDGAGKTRLMVIFGTGAAQQIAIEP